MTANVVVADLRQVKGDRLAAGVRASLGEFPGFVVLNGAPRHPLWRNSQASLARDLELLVAGGGKPADGVVVLTSLVLDVLRADSLALATHGTTRRRGAVAVEVAPSGRGEASRLLLVAADLTDAEWSSHERELRQRLQAMGYSTDAPVLVAAIGGRLATLDSLRSEAPAAYVDSHSADAGLRAFTTR